MKDTARKTVAFKEHALAAGDTLIDIHTQATQSGAICAHANSRYVIKPGVYFTALDGEGVLMDLAVDRYFGLTSVSAQIWQGLQEGLPLTEIAAQLAERRLATSAEAPGLVRNQLNAWIETTLVVPATAALDPRPRVKDTGIPARRGGYGRGADTQNVFSPRSCLVLVCASIWIRWTLRRMGLAETLRRLQTLRVPTDPHQRCEQRMHSLVTCYTWIRRPFMQGRQDCLIRSLTLTAALRRNGVDAEVCIGVRKFPFSAHAWVEVDGVVMNDTEQLLRPLSVLARF